MIIENVFNTLSGPVLYRLVIHYNHISTGFNVYTISAKSGSSSQTLLTLGVDNGVWKSIDQEFYISQSYRDLSLLTTITGPGGIDRYVYYKKVEAYKIDKAEVQDSDLTSGGRRFSYYEGSKMTSQDFNIDSPDTVDGGPVIVVNTVSPNTPSSSPIGTSTVQEGRAVVNRTPTSNAS